jgi:hypothetical protein
MLYDIVHGIVFQLDMDCVNLIIQANKSLFYTMIFTVIFL